MNENKVLLKVIDRLNRYNWKTVAIDNKLQIFKGGQCGIIMVNINHEIKSVDDLIIGIQQEYNNYDVSETAYNHYGELHHLKEKITLSEALMCAEIDRDEIKKLITTISIERKRIERFFNKQEQGKVIKTCECFISRDKTKSIIIHKSVEVDDNSTEKMNHWSCCQRNGEQGHSFYIIMRKNETDEEAVIRLLSIKIQQIEDEKQEYTDLLNNHEVIYDDENCQ